MTPKQNPEGHHMRCTAYMRNSLLSDWLAIYQSGMKETSSVLCQKCRTMLINVYENVLVSGVKCGG